MDSDKSKQNNTYKKITPSIFILLFVFLVVFFVFYMYYNQFGTPFHWAPLSKKADVWGQFGDYVGGVLNPILAFCAFAALLHTIKIQVEELKETRKEFKKSSEALDKQSQHFEREEIKTDLFRIIETMNNRLNENWNAEVEGGSLSMCAKNDNQVELLILKKRIKESKLFKSVCKTFQVDTLDLLIILGKYQKESLISKGAKTQTAKNELVVFFQNEAIARLVLVEKSFLITTDDNASGRHLNELLNDDKYSQLKPLLMSSIPL